MRPGESFIGQPVRSLQTMLRVIASIDQTIPSVVPDGIYGTSTTNAVIAFQQQNQLPPTGVADEATWNAIVSVYEEASIEVNAAESIEVIIDPEQIFIRGDRGPIILLLQAMLTQLSYDHKDIPEPMHTGILDSETSQSLEAFQKLAGLPQTGQLNKKTWKHLTKHFTLNAQHQSAMYRRVPDDLLTNNKFIKNRHLYQREILET